MNSSHGIGQKAYHAFRRRHGRPVRGIEYITRIEIEAIDREQSEAKRHAAMAPQTRPRPDLPPDVDYWPSGDETSPERSWGFWERFKWWLRMRGLA